MTGTYYYKAYKKIPNLRKIAARLDDIGKIQDFLGRASKTAKRFEKYVKTVAEDARLAPDEVQNLKDQVETMGKRVDDLEDLVQKYRGEVELINIGQFANLVYSILLTIFTGVMVLSWTKSLPKRLSAIKEIYAELLKIDEDIEYYLKLLQTFEGNYVRYADKHDSKQFKKDMRHALSMLNRLQAAVKPAQKKFPEHSVAILSAIDQIKDGIKITISDLKDEKLPDERHYGEEVYEKWGALLDLLASLSKSMMLLVENPIEDSIDPDILKVIK